MKHILSRKILNFLDTKNDHTSLHMNNALDKKAMLLFLTKTYAMCTNEKCFTAVFVESTTTYIFKKKQKNISQYFWLEKCLINLTFWPECSLFLPNYFQQNLDYFKTLMSISPLLRKKKTVHTSSLIHI